MSMEPFGENEGIERKAPEPAPLDSQPDGQGAGDPGVTQLEARLIEAVSTVYDPEIPVNIYELGLIYDIDVRPGGDVHIAMTLTSPACPVAGSLPGEVETRAAEVDGVGEVTVELVWDPPWTPDRMSEAARLELGFM